VSAEVVLASGNAGKLAEFRILLDRCGLRVLPVREFAEEIPEETGASFLSNALIKARHAARLSGRPALADDSGLAVEVLGGAPGIRSARFAGPNAGDADNNALLLERLRGVPEERRSACFHCVLVYLRAADDPSPLICEGIWRGRILEAPRGAGGFGYDPVPELGRSAAELSPEEKSLVSHRGQALRSLVARLRERLPDC
jgi:XTP/dITP diphosphohydrolase